MATIAALFLILVAVPVPTIAVLRSPSVIRVAPTMQPATMPETSAMRAALILLVATMLAERSATEAAWDLMPVPRATRTLEPAM